MKRAKTARAASPNAAVESEKAAVSEEARLAKADPNLFLRPWIALWSRNEKSTVINLEWEEDHPTSRGRKIKASWKVTGDPELGLPMPGDRRLFNVLCELTREQGLSQVVNFTRYDVLRRLDRSSGKRDYELLLNSFERLKAVKITARNVFRDARTGLIEDAVFSIIDDVTIVKAGRSGRIEPDELPLSSFSWSDRIYGNIQNGFLLTFDLNVVQSLRSDVALVLYPLLLAKTYDGPGRRRSHFHSELRDFYENHLGMRSTPYLSKMEERLLPAHEELKQIGFLADARIEPMKAPGQHKITYTLNTPKATPESLPEVSTEHPALPHAPQAMAHKLGEQGQEAHPLATQLFEPGKPVGGAQVLAPAELDAVLRRLESIGVDGAVARHILEQHSVEAIRLQLDCLADRKPRDPAALFLYAVRRDLGPPAPYLERIERQRREEAEAAHGFSSRQEAQEAVARARSAREASRSLLGASTAFYEGLCDEAKALVRYRVRDELRQGGVKGRWQYPQPLWMEVLCGLLRDEKWRQEMEQMHDQPEEPEELSEPIQVSLFARLDLYADTLREMIQNNTVNAKELDSVQESAFPLLDASEWAQVKARALGSE